MDDEHPFSATDVLQEGVFDFRREPGALIVCRGGVALGEYDEIPLRQTRAGPGCWRIEPFKAKVTARKWAESVADQVGWMPGVVTKDGSAKRRGNHAGIKVF